MIDAKSTMRGNTIAELLISTVIVLIILGFAAVLFKQAFTHHTLTRENMSNEQQARVALAKINSSLSQATVEANSTDFPNAPATPVIGANTFPTTTSTPSISFYRVWSLLPGNMPSPGGQPQPAYYVHIISYDSAGKTVNEFAMPYSDYAAGKPSPIPTILAQNVTDFGIMAIPGSSEYQFQITVSDVMNATLAEKPAHFVDNVHVMVPQ